MLFAPGANYSRLKRTAAGRYGKTKTHRGSGRLAQALAGLSMSSKDFRAAYLLLFAAFTALLGCSQQREAQISASATAVSMPDGSTQTRKSTAREKASLAEDLAKVEAINAQYPGSQTPWGAPSERAVQISVPGTVELQSGKKVRLDGIRCDEKAVGYLRRMLLDETISVIVIPSREDAAQPVPAEVWSADKELQNKGLVKSPAYSNVTETAIKSGWCEVEATQTNKHNERYAALAKAFQPAPVAR